MSDPTRRSEVEVIELAEQAAVYLRALLAEGVRMGTAVQLTSSFVSASVLAAQAHKEPRFPWDGLLDDDYEEDDGTPG